MSRRPGLDRTTLIQTAADIADTEGMEAVTLSSLAQRLGVRSPSLYNHIEGLPALRQALALHGTRMLVSELTDAVVGRAGDDAVRALCDAYISFAVRHPGLYDCTFAAPEPHEPELEAVSQHFLTLMLQAMQSYKLNDLDALHAVRGLRMMAHGYVSLERQRAYGMDFDPAESLNRLLNSFLRSLNDPLR
ncbi:WHG domain-containing protein [Paenibacillus sp. JX-17]|uniref:WHG domain-containing protein n=1 Tax=Paenibacillus lacisoli TaxID=3064525 RepID=A0ABT9CBV0_9BACL|nr:TetR/AcrR family transcriptional regulator [Paenibacillus sp. JX-17]MDO7906735.1 WHG domain-containing protein [Paenibacillus sp. JX-17]